MKRKVLLTGAAGRIGQFFLASTAERYAFTLTDRQEPKDTFGHPFIPADISDPEAVQPLCQGMDTVIHLAADPSMYAPWERLLPANIIGTYNVFEAAAQAGVRRIVYASSINAVFGYPKDVQVHTGMPVRPINLYGATKCWGEALARLYADRRGVSVHCLRFGAVQPRDSEMIDLEHPYIDIILTMEDCVRLMVASIEAPDSVRFGIFHGLSDNRYKRLDISDTREILGYEPQDDAFALARARSAAPQASTAQG